MENVREIYYLPKKTDPSIIEILNSQNAEKDDNHKIKYEIWGKEQDLEYGRGFLNAKRAILLAKHYFKLLKSTQENLKNRPLEMQPVEERVAQAFKSFEQEITQKEDNITKRLEKIASLYRAPSLQKLPQDFQISFNIMNDLINRSMDFKKIIDLFEGIQRI